MTYTPLVGTEKLEVLAIAENGQFSGQTQGCTTQMIADLAAQSAQGNTAVTTSASSVITSTTLKNVTGLSVNVLAGQIYAYLAISANASNGVKVALGGTAGLSSVNYTAQNYNTTTLNANSNTTTAGAAVGGATAASTLVLLEGAVSVATGGTLTVQFAQNASTAIATQVLTNSYLALV